MDKDYVVSINNGIIKNDLFPYAPTWVDLKDVMLSEISQKETDKYCMISSVQFSHAVVSGMPRLPCPSPAPEVCSNLCLSSR